MLKSTLLAICIIFADYSIGYLFRDDGFWRAGFLVGRGRGTYAPPRSSIFYKFKPRPCCCLENRERDGRLHFFCENEL